MFCGQFPFLMAKTRRLLSIILSQDDADVCSASNTTDLKINVTFNVANFILCICVRTFSLQVSGLSQTV